MNNQTKKTFRGLSMREWKNWAIGYAIALPAAFLGGTVYHNSSAANAPTTEPTAIVKTVDSNYSRGLEASATNTAEIAPAQVIDERQQTQSLENKIYGNSQTNLPRIEVPHNQCYRKPIIVLDPGHGKGNKGKKNDPGAIALDEDEKVVLDAGGKPIHESYVVFNQAVRMKELLESRGYDVYLTRDENTPAPLNSRVKLADNLKADLFVSLHLNAAAADKNNNTTNNHKTNPNVSGTEIYYKNDAESPQLAKLVGELIPKYVNSIPGQEASLRGVHPNPHYFVLSGKRPSVLIESGFVTNTAGEESYGPDLRYLGSKTRAAELAMVDSIDYFMQTVRIPEMNRQHEQELKTKYTPQKTPSKAPKNQPYSRGRR